MLSKYVTQAMDIAIRAHGEIDQEDRMGFAYVTHPIRVAIRLKNVAVMNLDRSTEDFREHMKGYENALAAAVLHDVLEDTKWTAQDLLDAGMTSETVEHVKLLTHDPIQSYADYIEEISHAPTWTILVKLSDIEDNTEAWREKKGGKVPQKYIDAKIVLHAELQKRGFHGFH